jgi:hypothetical protein
MLKIKPFVANPLYIFSFTSKKKPLDLCGWFEYEVWGVGYFIHFQISYTTQFFNNYPISSNCLSIPQLEGTPNINKWMHPNILLNFEELMSYMHFDKIKTKMKQMSPPILWKGMHLAFGS